MIYQKKHIHTNKLICRDVCLGLDISEWDDF